MPLSTRDGSASSPQNFTLTYRTWPERPGQRAGHRWQQHHDHQLLEQRPGVKLKAPCCRAQQQRQQQRHGQDAQHVGADGEQDGHGHVAAQRLQAGRRECKGDCSSHCEF